MIRTLPLPTRTPFPALALCALLAACGGGGSDSPPTDPQPGPILPAEPSAPSGNFTLRSSVGSPVLVEGGPDLVVPLTLERLNGHDTEVTLSIAGATEADVARVTHTFDTTTLGEERGEARVTLRLDIADRSIMPGARRFYVIASDGESNSRYVLDVDVEPVDAPDVYLLVGQSNMVGSSGDGTRRADPGAPDERNDRVRQLNVPPNDGFSLFTDAEDFRSPELASVGVPIVTAEDPLHVPAREGGEAGKGFEYIGLGLTFGKTALADTTREVVLVPAAWSGSAFCDNDAGPPGQWNARPTDVAALGNTWLFDRAVLRADKALAESGGILRGILWHQGESDAKEECAPLYADNLELLAEELRRRIAPDARGPALRTANAPIPFVVGTMSRGDDERGPDYSELSPPKALIDQVHRSIADRVAYSAVSIHDDLVPANGYPCGQGDCIHFGAEALREMGRRYHAALEEALAAPGDDAAGNRTTTGGVSTSR